MKKSVIFTSTAAVIFVAVLFTGCQSTESFTTYSNELRSDSIVINTMMERSDYKVLGKVTGESDFVYYDSEVAKFIGDSLKYGKLNTPESITVAKGLAAGVNRYTNMNKYSPFNVAVNGASNSNINALEIAKQNALYELIQNAFAMDADSIIEPVYTVETNIEKTNKTIRTSYKVTVRAIAIQLMTK